MDSAGVLWAKFDTAAMRDSQKLAAFKADLLLLQPSSWDVDINDHLLRDNQSVMSLLVKHFPMPKHPQKRHYLSAQSWQLAKDKVFEASLH